MMPPANPPLPKLTPRQRDVLTDMLRPCEKRGADLSYPPVKKLLALGLLTSGDQRFGGKWIMLTPDGERVREALANG